MLIGVNAENTAQYNALEVSGGNTLYINHGGYYTNTGATYLRGKNTYVQTKEKFYINGIAYEGNKVLWSGGYVMTAGHTASLSEEVSKQANGIVIVFSRYSNGASVDWNWQTFFIPKKMVELFNGGGHSFTLMSNGMAGFGQKYLYVYDNQIVGHANNNTAGTSSATNIKYDNALFVMRYVIGV